MKKRIISLLLALIMALSLLPVSVLAADDHTGQVHVTVENTTWAKADGAPWEGTLVDEWVTLKADSTMMSCIFARPAILWITSEPDSRSCALKRN